MTEEKNESTRNLLAEIEGGWGTPSPPGVDDAAPAPLDAAAPASTPNVDALDDGWLDDLFPDDEDDEADDADEEPEPELPDERLDPVAFAEAKKAREERAARRKEKRRAKAEAKRARQKARGAAARQKQKTKKSRPSTAKAETAKPAAKSDDADRSSSRDVADAAHDAPAPKEVAEPRPRRVAPKGKRIDTVASIKLLAIVLAVLLGLAAAAAAVFR